MSYQIVLLSGKQGSGKSTIQSQLMAGARDVGFTGAHGINFADALYALHDAVLDTLDRKFGVARLTAKDGVLLQLLGTEWGRKVYGTEIWVDIVKNRIDMIDKIEGHHLIIIADCRFENEFNAFPGAVRVRLVATEDERKHRTTSWRPNTSHASEVSLDDYSDKGKFDFYFTTEPGLLDYTSVDLIASRIFKKLEILKIK